MDNCSAHLKMASLSNIRIVYYQANTSAIMQALDLGVIKNFKDNFWRMHFQSLVSNLLDEGLDLNVSILDAINWAKLSLEKIKETTITKCFEKSLTESKKNTLLKHNILSKDYIKKEESSKNNIETLGELWKNGLNNLFLIKSDFRECRRIF